MLLLSSSSSGGRLRSSQAHLALTPLRFEPSVSIPLSTLSCLKRSKTPQLFWMWLDPELKPSLAPSIHVLMYQLSVTAQWVKSGTDLNWNKPGQAELLSFPHCFTAWCSQARDRGGNERSEVYRVASFNVSSSLQQLKVPIYSYMQHNLAVYLLYATNNKSLNNYNKDPFPRSPQWKVHRAISHSQKIIICRQLTQPLLLMCWDIHLRTNVQGDIGSYASVRAPGKILSKHVTTVWCRTSTRSSQMLIDTVHFFQGHPHLLTARLHSELQPEDTTC